MNGHSLPWLDTAWEPETLREEPLEDLLETAVEFSDATEGMLERLAAIRVSLSDGGIDVTVTIDGQLVALSLSDKAMELGGPGIATAVHRLTTEAAARAISQGIAVLTPIVGIEIAEQLSAATGLDALNAEAAAEPVTASATAPATTPEPRPVPERRRRPAPVVDDEDFSTLETWAVRD